MPRLLIIKPELIHIDSGHAYVYHIQGKEDWDVDLRGDARGRGHSGGEVARATRGTMKTATKESLLHELATTQQTMARQTLLKQLWKLERQSQDTQEVAKPRVVKELCLA